MFAKRVSRVLGGIAGALALLGLSFENEHLAGLANVDLPLDLARLVIAGALLWVGYRAVRPAVLAAVLAVIGITYVLMGALALFDAEMFGLLPTGLTVFDVAFHLIAGLLASAAAFTIHPEMDPAASGSLPAR